jgi:hypothetical protein
MTSHQEIDQRSLALHQLIAEKIRQDPRLFENMKRTLTLWRTIVSADSQPYLEEWERLVDLGIEECLAVATEDSERANAMRQASPFCGILTNEERWEFLLAWDKDHGASEQEIKERRQKMIEDQDLLEKNNYFGKNPHIGSSFDDFLAEEAILEEATAVAMERIADRQRKRK